MSESVAGSIPARLHHVREKGTTVNGLAILQKLGQGNLIDKLGDTIETVAKEVQETGTAGTVTLTIQIKPAKGMSNGVVMDEKLKRTPPVHAPEGAFFYVGQGLLHLEDPR